jgi:hypothetical protein
MTTKALAQNGTDALTPDFPVDSFLLGARHLRRPFTAAAVKFKVQAVWPKDDPTGGLIVAYIDARLAVERLNLVMPHLWHDAYRPVGSGQMWCDLTVDGITRSDVGEGVSKGLVSDALKRAAVKFGIGVSLYAIPKMILNASDGTLKQKQTRDGKTLELTPKGEALLRTMYTAWLDQHGRQAFGEPLDHGDVEDAQGDPVEVPPGVDAQTGEVTESIDTPSDAQMKELRRQVTTSRPHIDVLREMLKVAGAGEIPDAQIEDGSWATKVTRTQVSKLLDIFKGGSLPDGSSDIPNDLDPPPDVEPGDDLPFDAVGAEHEG